MPSPRRTQPPSEPVVPSRLRWVAAAIAGLAVAGGAWLFWPTENKLAAVTDMQRTLLAAGGPPSRAAVDALIRTVDRMTRREVWAAYAAAGTEWKRIKQEAITGYFAATAADRPRLLDEHLERMAAYHDLLVAMNPSSGPDSPAYLPRDRRRRGESQQPPADVEAEKARGELVKQFDDAVAARAKSRGVPLPTFR